MSCPLGRFVTLLAVSKWVKYFRINYGINQMRFKVTLRTNSAFFGVQILGIITCMWSIRRIWNFLRNSRSVTKIAFFTLVGDLEVCCKYIDKQGGTGVVMVDKHICTIYAIFSSFVPK
jgi:hypothetical protein